MVPLHTSGASSGQPHDIILCQQNLFLFWFCLHITTLLIHTYQFTALFQHKSAALRTFLCRWLLPGHKIAFWKIHAAKIPPALSAHFHYKIPTAVRTFYADLLKKRLCVAAVRKSRTSKELSMRSVFNHHVSAAFLTDHVCDLILYGYFLQFLLCNINRLFQIRIEIFNDSLPFNGSVLYTVQKFTTSPSSVTYNCFCSFAT